MFALYTLVFGPWFCFQVHYLYVNDVLTEKGTLHSEDISICTRIKIYTLLNICILCIKNNTDGCAEILNCSTRAIISYFQTSMYCSVCVISEKFLKENLRV